VDTQDLDVTLGVDGIYEVRGSKPTERLADEVFVSGIEGGIMRHELSSGEMRPGHAELPATEVLALKSEASTNRQYL
jgi:hypothetical protein